MFLNHGIAALPAEKRLSRYEPSPAKLAGVTNYMRNFSPINEEELKLRIENAR